MLGNQTRTVGQMPEDTLSTKLQATDMSRKSKPEFTIWRKAIRTDAKPRNVDMVGGRGRRRPLVSLDTGRYPRCKTYSCGDEAIFDTPCKASLYRSQSLPAYVRHYTTP